MELHSEDRELLSIVRIELGAPGTPAEGDLLLDVSVSSSGYSAADQVWVLAEEWRRFTQELSELEESRQGRATLEGMSPRELMLIFHSTDALGHMAVAGSLGGDKPNGFVHKLAFGFAFDPSRLPTVVREISALGS